MYDNWFLSLLITMVIYSLFPLIFAAVRREPITKKRYRTISFVFNFLICLPVQVIADTQNLSPYVLWTMVSTYFGVKILRKDQVLDEYKPEQQKRESPKPQEITPRAIIQPPERNPSPRGIYGRDIALHVDAPAINEQQTNEKAALFYKVFQAYINPSPIDQAYYKKMLGTKELKEAYLYILEENNRNAQMGETTNFTPAYTHFMSQLYYTYKTDPTAPAAPITAESSQAYCFCRKCGTKLPKDSSFCTKCGTEIIKEATDE